MSTQPFITCDGPNCGRIKRDVNHWFVVSTRRDSTSAFYMNRFENATEREIECLSHACSRECALKLASLWMEGDSHGSATLSQGKRENGTTEAAH